LATGAWETFVAGEAEDVWKRDGAWETLAAGAGDDELEGAALFGRYVILISERKMPQILQTLPIILTSVGIE